MSGQPMQLTTRDPFRVPAGDFARPGLVDAGFVQRSVEAMRDMPDAEKGLRKAIKDCLASIEAIDLVYGAKPNEWATVTRERLWLEYFTDEAILGRLSSAAGITRLDTSETSPSATRGRRIGSATASTTCRGASADPGLSPREVPHCRSLPSFS
ncbi:MAG: hypothetical protein NT154_26325 [Verrucomicrobia bacterium]|nr:hypothetical protein [Verrucomicrobiota bacterium]